LFGFAFVLGFGDLLPGPAGGILHGSAVRFVGWLAARTDGSTRLLVLLVVVGLGLVVLVCLRGHRTLLTTEPSR
jgi:hypothetical protein